MSLVGTRPPTVDEWEKYELHHRSRMSTKPGITGMWQVSGRSDITDFEEVVRLDTEYIEHWTITFNYDSSQRHIMIVGDNCTVEKELKIVFNTKEQADGFKGMCFSWE